MCVSVALCLFDTRTHLLKFNLEALDLMTVSELEICLVFIMFTV